MEQVEIRKQTTVGAVVARYPLLMPMLEALGIDYCCGGKQTLEAAAEAAGMPVERLQAVLRASIAQQVEAPVVQSDWQSASLDELMEHIVQLHHSFMYRELPRISELLNKVGRAHGERHGDVLVPLAETYAVLRGEIEDHLKDEEQRTFPLIRKLLAGHVDAEVSRAVTELEHEHDTAGAALARMRSTTRDYAVPEDACATYCALYEALQALERDLHQHIHLENNILFPRTRQLLAAVER